MNLWYPQVAKRAGNRCEYCMAPERLFNFPFEVEHIIPENKGGDDLYSNLALACRSCNCFKSDRVVYPDPETEIEVDLFNPRFMDWDHHFEFVSVDFQIRGVAPQGRATVDGLMMNAGRQVMARAQWFESGAFP